MVVGGMVVRKGQVIGVGVEDRGLIERRVEVSEGEGARGRVEEGSWKAWGEPRLGDPSYNPFLGTDLVRSMIRVVFGVVVESQLRMVGAK